MTGKITIGRLGQMKKKGEKIAALTAYDYSFAKLVDAAGVEIILVGDSLGMAFRGDDNTLKVTLEDMAYHTSAVRKGVERALLVADMPFLSYHINVETALINAGRLISEGAEAVKLEGCDGVAETVTAMLQAGIPVMGHIGLTPQSIHKLGGFRIQGRQADAAKKLVDEALTLEGAGVFSIVLECVPADLAETISGKLRIPTIGIGAGAGCDGQILVTNDLLGMPSNVTPKFVKKYADLSLVVHGAVREYMDETKSGKFPGEEHSYTSTPRHLKAI